MSLLKKGTISSQVVVSSSTYLCSNCGHLEVSRGDPAVAKKCPKCGEPMSLSSSHAESSSEE